MLLSPALLDAVIQHVIFRLVACGGVLNPQSILNPQPISTRHLKKQLMPKKPHISSLSAQRRANHSTQLCVDALCEL